MLSCFQAKLDDLYDDLQRELQNERNWVNDMEATLRNQPPISDEETKIPKQDAKALLKLCEKGMIEKIRYEVECGKHIFEVDEFLGLNKGLIIAEIELQSEDEFFTKPTWLGKEVTGDIRYYNSQLAKFPAKSN